VDSCVSNGICVLRSRNGVPRARPVRIRPKFPCKRKRVYAIGIGSVICSRGAGGRYGNGNVLCRFNVIWFDTVRRRPSTHRVSNAEDVVGRRPVLDILWTNTVYTVPGSTGRRISEFRTTYDFVRRQLFTWPARDEKKSPCTSTRETETFPIAQPVVGNGRRNRCTRYDFVYPARRTFACTPERRDIYAPGYRTGLSIHTGWWYGRDWIEIP